MKDLLSHFKKKQNLKPLAAKDLSYLTKELSAEYAEWLEKTGAVSFDNGFLFLVNPADFKQIAKDIFPGKKAAIVLARTSFGDLFLLHENTFFLYQSSYHKTMEVATDLDYFFNDFLTQGSFADKFLFRDLHKKAKKTLGDLAYDECYGFIPALPMGGEENVNSLQKVKLMEYVSMLIQAKQF